MAEFAYKVRDAAGKTRKGKLNAKDEAAGAEQLRKRNLVVLSMKEQAKGKGALDLDLGKLLFGGSREAMAKRAKVKPEALNVFTRQLATMVSAGLPLLESLDILSETADDPCFRAVVETLVLDIRTGADFSDALRQHKKVFESIYVNMVRAGEASGKLDDILARLADYQEEAAELKQRIKSAMTYPIISLVMITGISMGLLIGIVPKFKAIFAGMKVEMPAITTALMGVSDWMVANVPTIIVGLIVLAIAYKMYGRTEKGRRHLDFVFLKLPVFGQLFERVEMSRFAKTFATLVEAGVPILAALDIVASTIDNSLIADAVVDASAAVRQGEELATPLAESGRFPLMVTRMIGIGEKSGALETLLYKISHFYDQQVKAMVDNLTSLIEPVLIVVMGVVVGGMVMAIFFPIMKMAQSMGG